MSAKFTSFLEDDQEDGNEDVENEECHDDPLSMLDPVDQKGVQEGDHSIKEECGNNEFWIFLKFNTTKLDCTSRTIDLELHHILLDLSHFQNRVDEVHKHFLRYNQNNDDWFQYLQFLFHL